MMLEHEYTVGPPTDQVVQHVWGLQYIDDLVLNRQDSNTDGDYIDSGDFTHYALTDHQFSVAALIDSAGNLIERVSYTPYGEARHHWRQDVDGDGDIDATDQTIVSNAQGKRIYESGYNVDADFDRNGIIDSNDSRQIGSGAFRGALPAGWISSLTTGNMIGFSGYVFNREIDAGGLYTVRFRHYDPVWGRWTSRDRAGYRDSMSLYGYGAGTPASMGDPFGLWGIRFGNFQIGSGDPWLHFTSDSWSHLGQGAAATADGVIPFWDPFADAGVYDPDDPDYKLSQTMGVVAREVALLAVLIKMPPGSSWRLWARNPVKYEIGSATMPKAIFEAMELAIGKNATALAKFEWLLKNGHISWKMIAYAFLSGGNLASGPTPGGWIGALILFLEGLFDLLSSDSGAQSTPAGSAPGVQPSMSPGDVSPAAVDPGGGSTGGTNSGVLMAVLELIS